jgi:hypothetical protein
VGLINVIILIILANPAGLTDLPNHICDARGWQVMLVLPIWLCWVVPVWCCGKLCRGSYSCRPCFGCGLMSLKVLCVF